MKKIRVLFLMQLPPPVHGASVASSCIKSSVLVNNLFDCVFFDISSAKNVSELGTFTIKKCINLIQKAFLLLKCLLINKFDILYITLSPNGFAFYKDFLLMKLCMTFIKSPVVIHLHGKGVRRASFRNLFSFWVYKCAFYKGRVIQLSFNLYSDIIHLVSLSNVFFVPNGVSVDNLPLKTFKEGAKLKFVYLSNFMSQKGALELLKACKVLESYSSSFDVIFAGRFCEPEFESAFLSLYNMYDLSNIVLYKDGIYGSEKEKILNNSHVFVLPTYYSNECFPISILEAMSRGCAVVTTNEGAISDIVIDKLTGLIVKPKDVEALANAMLFLIESPGLVLEMGMRSYMRCHDLFSIEKFEVSIADCIYSCYNERVND